MERFLNARNSYLNPTEQPAQFNTWMENAARAGHIQPPGGYYNENLPQRSRANMDNAIKYHTRMKQEMESLEQRAGQMTAQLRQQESLMVKATARIKELEAQNSKLRVPQHVYSQPPSRGPSQSSDNVPRQRRVAVAIAPEPSVRDVGDVEDHHPQPASGGGGGEHDDSAMPVEVLPSGGGADSH